MTSQASNLDRLRRLAGMSVSEITTRTRQEAWKLLGRWAGRRPPVANGAARLSCLPITPALVDFRRTAEVARALDRSAAEKVVERADRICDGKFGILGFGALDFGEPVDWHLDPINDRRAPPVHFSRINYLDAQAVGDHKIIWELNRHFWLLTLAQANALTGDDRYARRAAQLLRGWIEANPIDVGINWTSSLEAGLRSIAWLYVWPTFSRSRYFKPQLLRAWGGCLDAHARHISRFTSDYFAPNTHLTGEGLALYLIGLACTRLYDAPRYRRLGRRILASELERQVRADGFHYEQSACYHRYTLEFIILAIIAASLNEFHPPGGMHPWLAVAADATLPLLQPDGLLVNIGDEDGGQLFEFGTRDPLDARPVLAAAALLLQRGDLKAVTGELPAEVVWLLGPDAVAGYETLEAADPLPASRALSQAGYCGLRNGWDPSGDHLLFDAGPHGSNRCRYGHSHSDALSISVMARGQSFISDPGTGSYIDADIREALRGTFAHSTAWIDGEPHCWPQGAFAWAAVANGKLIRWLTSDDFDLAEGVHDGYLRGDPGIRHSRLILYWKRRGWLLRDVFEGHGQHEITLQFVLAHPPDRVLADGLSVTTQAGSLGVLPPSGAADISTSLEASPVSPRYGQVKRGSAWRANFTVHLPVDIITLIRATAPAPSLQPLAFDLDSQRARTSARQFRDAETGDLFFVRGLEKEHSSLNRPLRTDSEIAWLAPGNGEGLAVQGRRLEVDGRTVVDANRIADWRIRNGLASRVTLTGSFGI